VGALPGIAEWRDRGHFVSFGRHRVFCVDSAPDGRDKPTLLLVHGFPTSSWDWAKVWAPLAERFRLIAPDMLGFGYTSKPRDHDYTIMEQADLVENVLERCGVGAHHMLAHDYVETVCDEVLSRVK
jgi:pimeloyl-ACP methyl ester carboxylesterase